jgi:hypothetical protein
MRTMMQNSEQKYVPLTIEFSLHTEQQRKSLFAKFHRLVLGLLLCDHTYTKQIKTQMQSRKEFPRSEWEKLFQNIAKIETTLRQIAEDTAKVNHHFIPADTLFCILWDEHHDYFNCQDLSKTVQRIFGVNFSVDDIVQMANENITLEMFFREIIKKMTSSDDQRDANGVDR